MLYKPYANDDDDDEKEFEGPQMQGIWFVPNNIDSHSIK